MIKNEKMVFEHHRGIKEEGVLIGNQLDKATLRNPIARWMIANFDEKILKFTNAYNAKSIHDVGCGEGRLARRIYESCQVPIRASDFSFTLIEENVRRNDAGISYVHRSINHLNAEEDYADLVICCEVLEHVEQPSDALKSLRTLGANQYLLSVLHEPVWRILNCIRGKYIRDFGNTPGHINHWSMKEFKKFLYNAEFSITKILNPFPWIMVTGVFRK